jgi:biopolymer transport protein ExbD
MTNIENTAGPFRQRAGVRRAVKHACKIDMTPMVDLGFLLISFFVITTELSKPRAMELYMPADGTCTDLGASNALTVIPAADNKIYYYFGKWEDAVNNGTIHTTSYSGDNSLRKIIIHKQEELDRDTKSKEKRNGLMLLVKPTSSTTYKNIVDVLDETAINQVKKYALLKITAAEEEWVKTKSVNE